MTPLWGPGPTGDHRLHLPTKPQGYEGRTPAEEHSTRGAAGGRAPEAGQGRASSHNQARPKWTAVLGEACHSRVTSGEEAGLSVTQGHGKLPTAGLVCNCQHKEPPTQARTPLYFYAQGVDRNTKAWTSTPLQCLAARKDTWCLQGWGQRRTDNGRQFQATVHSLTSEMQETRGSAFIILRRPNTTTPSPGQNMGTDSPRAQDMGGKKRGHGPKVTPMASAPASQEAGWAEPMRPGFKSQP